MAPSIRTSRSSHGPIEQRGREGILGKFAALAALVRRKEAQAAAVEARNNTMRAEGRSFAPAVAKHIAIASIRFEPPACSIPLRQPYNRIAAHG